MNQHARIDMQPIPFIDLAAQRRRLGKQDRRSDCARDRALPVHPGPGSATLETELAAFGGAKHAISCASGTDALVLVLMAKEHRAGRRGDLPELHVLRHRRSRGAARRDAGVRRCRCRHVQHQYRERREGRRDGEEPGPQAQGHHAGRSVRPAGRSRCDRRNSPKPKTCSCSTMPRRPSARTYKGKRVGTLRRTRPRPASFPAKPLGCYGDGGAILTDDDELADILKSLRVHGQGTDKYDNVRIGMTGRLDTMQAAVLLEKLKIFPEEIVARQQVADRYAAALGDVAIVPTRAGWLHLGVGAIHDPAEARRARRARRGAESCAAFRPRSIIPSRCTGRPPTSSSRWRTAGCRCRISLPTKSSACRCIPISMRRRRIVSSLKCAAHWDNARR